MQVLSLGLPRTGSASLAEAFAILGYQGVFHGLNVLDDDDTYRKLGCAADATFPVLQSYTGVPYSNDDWNNLYGEYEVTTDMASFFAPQLIEAYPDAKVVLVKRDYDSWYKSVDEGLLQPIESWLVQFHIKYIEPVAGLVTGCSGQKVMLGYFEAKNIQEIRVNARRIYDTHYRTIEELVPSDRLLKYDFKDGWGPLCTFLGKPIPDVPFPRVNETAAIRAKIREKVFRDARQAVPVLLKWSVGAAVVAVLSWSLMSAT